MNQSDRLRIAVFIDFDNIEIGVKNTMGASFDAGLVLEALKERGEVVSKTAYSDWQRAGGYSRSLTQHAIKMVQRNLTPGGDKNGADINLALDALEMAFTHSHINAFVIVGGDSDFISLVEKLKQYDKKVFIVGGRQFTSAILQRNCHEFIAYENLAGAAAPPAGRRQSSSRDVRAERASLEQAIPLVQRGLKVLLEREVSPQLGLLKSTLIQLDSTFSERNYGASSFSDFVQKLEKIGVVRVVQAKGAWLVGLPDAGQPSVEAGPSDEPEASASADQTARGADGQVVPFRQPTAVPDTIGTQAEGLREFRSILSSAQIRRWPMYLRNVKQIIRQVSQTFDERAYGFGNLVDLLRVAQKEGLVRVERDRQGVIRVFQGAAPLAAGADSAAEPLAIQDAQPQYDEADGEGEPDMPSIAIPTVASEFGVTIPADLGPDEDLGPQPGNSIHEPDAGGDQHLREPGAKPARRQRRPAARPVRPAAARPASRAPRSRKKV